MKIAALIGQTLASVEGCKKGSEEIIFTTIHGAVFAMNHEQSCCESVLVEDVCGDPNDLIGEPILQAEESTSETNPTDYKEPEYPPDSATWSFYRISTIKGQVALSGGYSESVEFSLRG